MVYSTKIERPIISEKPLKTERTPGAHSKEVREFTKSHSVSVQTDANGKVTVKSNVK